jgi:hypothetical protein
LIEKNLLRTDELSVIDNCGLGIDASHYIRQLFLRPTIKASLSSAIGGVPGAMRAEVERDMSILTEQKTVPLFVFDGFDLHAFQGKESKTFRPDPSMERRRTAWDEWLKLAEKGPMAEEKDREAMAQHTREVFENGTAFMTFTNEATSIPTGVELQLMQILFEKNIEFVVAPVSAKAQVKLFSPLSKISSPTSIITLPKTTSTASIVIQTYSCLKSIALFSA